MPNGLNRQKDGVQPKRHHDDENGLKRRKGWARRGHRIIRNNQPEHGQWHDDRQERIGAHQVVRLLTISKSADHQRHADHPVEHQHDYGKHRVAGHGRLAMVAVHDRSDHHDFQAGDGQRQDQRPQRFSHVLGQGFGMSDNRKCRAKYHDKQPSEQRCEPQRIRQMFKP